MVFRFLRRHDPMSAMRIGRSRFRQSTALIGATLLFCLAGVGAEADTLYYNSGKDGGSPNPATGSVWSNFSDVWVERDTNGSYAGSNSDFDNGDDVHFLTAGGAVIEIEIDDTPEPGVISVDQGSFRFNDENTDDGTITGDSLNILAGGSLESNVDIEISGAISVAGDLIIGLGHTLTAGSTGVAVNGGSLDLRGTIDGGVLVNAGGEVTLGSGSFIDGTLTFDGATYSGGGHVDLLVIRPNSDVTFGGTNARVDRNVLNAGSLTLGQGSYAGRLVNGGALVLSRNVGFGEANASIDPDGDNWAGASITASGGSRTLSFARNFNNNGSLRGGAAGSSLTIEAETLILGQTTEITGDVILSGAIDSSADLDLVHVPVLEGEFINRSLGTATVTSAVNGNGQFFENAGSLQVSGGNLTGLASLTNTGSVSVAAGRTLGAATIDHDGGTLTSLGTLRGAITSNATANIRGVIDGSLEVADGVTTITGALTATGAADGQSLKVGTAGELVIADSTSVTVDTLVNDGDLRLGNAASGSADITITGNVINSGDLSGEARITGNLTLTGSSATDFTGSIVTVDGALINDLDAAVRLGDFVGIGYGSVGNLGNLTIADAAATDLANLAGGTLTVNAALTGNLTSSGTTALNGDVIGQLQVLGGVTTVGPNTAGGPVLVGGGTTQELIVGPDGSLQLSGGDLTSSGWVRATGRVRVSQARTLTTPRLHVAGDSGSWVRGTVAGEINVAATGVLELDGATVTGRVYNSGRLNGADTTGQSVRMQDGLQNGGVIRMASQALPVIISGVLRNEAGGDAEIRGNVIADGAGAANAVNLGLLQLTGNVAGTVTNSGALTLTGNAAQVVNNAGATATLSGTIGTASTPDVMDISNSGTLSLTGAIANSLENIGTATVSGTIGGNAVNTGTLNLAGDVALQIQNTGAAAIVNITGNSQATDLVNTGTVNVQSGRVLDLTSGQLTNVAGAVLNVSGRVETSAASGALALQNNAGGTLRLGSSGTVAGNVNNAGSASVAGTVTGNLVNASSGFLSLRDGAQIDGTLNNQGNATVVAGETATVAGGTTNSADLEIRGELVSDVVNSGGTIDLNGGTITGNVRNDLGSSINSGGTITGDVDNDGTYTVDLISRVEGDFVNDGLLTQSQDGSRLVVTDVFTNNGTIDARGSWTFTVSADDYVNNGQIIGSVLIDGDIGNAGQIIYTHDTDLLGDLSNQDNAVVRVLATVTGNGDNVVTNRGIFEVSADGALVNVDTITNHDRFSIAAGGRVQANDLINSAGLLTNGGVIDADVSNQAGAQLTSTGTIEGDLANAGTASLQGRVNGGLSTGRTGNTTVTAGGLAVTGPLRNDGTMLVSEGARLSSTQTIVNGGTGTLTALGAISGNLVNYNVAQVFGGLTGTFSNAGEALLSGTIGGALVNNSTDGSAVVRIRDRLQVGSVNNQSGTLIVAQDRSLTVANQFQNGSAGILSVAGTVNLGAGQALQNDSSGRVSLLAGSTLNGDLLNDGRASLAGTVNGSVLNRESITGAGLIAGDLTNEGGSFETGGNLVIRGEVTNRRAPLNFGRVAQPGAAQRAAPGDPALLRVSENTTLTATGGVTNDAFSTVQVYGTLNGSVSNSGQFNLSNRLNGTLVNSGTAELAGEITRDLLFREGSIALTGDLTVGGTFDAFQNFTVGTGRTLTAGLYNNRADQRLTVDGRLAGAVNNLGTIDAGNGVTIDRLTNAGTVLVDRSLNIQGALVNNGRMNLQNARTGDVLTVNGSAGGTGVYALDLDLNGNDRRGAADRVVVRGGAVTGSILLSFDAADIDAPDDESRRILVFDVDGSRGSANDFTFAAENLPQASERIIYALVRDGQTGDIFVTDTINPALGALAGNLALTQSLIGSVVNRPTSPFVPGLATDAGAQKCGPGAWARAVAGHASATGQSQSGDVRAASEIEASYRGLQFGGDLACFENSVHGWNVALGVLGGVNDGSTTQPVYINNSTDPNSTGGLLTSINRGDFRQIYGGVYATASRDRLSLDLQLRRERTEFTIDNEPVGSNDGLQLATPDFDSDATTISGSLSYALDLPKDGWMFVPTAGFAFSNLSVDKITFTTGDTLQIEDSQNRVGFIGGTLSKTFINPAKNSAVYAFGTATVYKDFANDTNSVYTMVGADGSVVRTDELSSSNLGTYGELSLGANYLKVLETGRAGAPRQFNASIRVDGRTGDVLDSYGVTAQVRFQF